MESGQPKLNFEEPQIKSDGTQTWLKTSKVPLHDKDGHVIGVLGTYEDITEHKGPRPNWRLPVRCWKRSCKTARTASTSKINSRGLSATATPSKNS